MEDVGSIGMNVDRVFVEVIEAISADVIFSIDNDNLVDVSNEASPQGQIRYSCSYQQNFHDNSFRDKLNLLYLLCIIIKLFIS